MPSTGLAVPRLVDRAALDAGHQEIKELLSFLGGSIQVPEVRHHLWRGWGFCPRHAWISAVVECELRARPFGTTILYADLVARAACLLGAAYLPRAVRVRRLRARADCFTCQYLRIAPVPDPRSRDRTSRVNRREAVRRLLRDSRSEWEPRSCPECLGGDGPTCRLHLLGGTAASLPGVAAALDELAGRLQVLTGSMTWKGPIAPPADRASWIEALGWFAGWSYPIRALEE